MSAQEKVESKVKGRDDFIKKIDKVIGDKVYSLRLGNGLSRQELSDEIGVTHQQLQKYEKGINRISFGRLVLIAKALGCPIEHFYSDLHNISTNDNDNAGEEDLTPTQHQRMCIEVARNFMKIRNPEHQTAVNTLVRSLVRESA